MERIGKVFMVILLCILCFVSGIGSFFLYLPFSDYVIVRNDVYNKTSDLPEPNSGFANPVTIETALQKESVDLNTRYRIIKVNEYTGEETILSETIPQALIGANREQTEDFIQEYAIAPTLKDKEEGFVSASLSEFSPTEIVIEKRYRPLEKDVFYLKAEENNVVVYCSDLSTVYLYTNISVDSLPEDTKEELKEGKKITSREKLYSFLESNTS